MKKDSNTKVLIVDDNEQLAEILYNLLSCLGVKSSIANDGAEAIEYLTAKEFNIVITDFNMPKMNGLELIKYIRKDTALKDIKIILMSGGNDDELSNAIKMADGHMLKPFNYEKLKLQIDSLSIKNNMDVSYQ